MVQVTFENVLPLLEKTKKDGSELFCVFKCPVSGDKFAAFSEFVISQNNSTSESSLQLGRARFNILNFLSSVFKQDSKLAPSSKTVQYDAVAGEFELIAEPEYKEAVVQAFISLKNRFIWDDQMQSWVSHSTIDDDKIGFETFIRENPVSGTKEKEALGKVLLKIAAADNRLHFSERVFLSDFVEKVPENLEELSQYNSIKIDLSPFNGSGKMRESVLLLAWVMAITDKNLHEKEIQYLEQLSKILEIPKKKAEEISILAKRYVFFKVIEADYFTGSIEINDAYHSELAKKLLLPELESAKIKSLF